MPEHAATLDRPQITVGVAFIILLSALMALTSLSTDIYLPAMPVMARELHGDAELTITGFLIGFTLAQLIWGPLSDHLGRKTPLFIGMVLFIVGSAGCAMSTSMMQIVFWRVYRADAGPGDDQRFIQSFARRANALYADDSDGDCPDWWPAAGWRHH